MASNTPKTMSSRLMTMKFMQRSAAKSVTSEPSTPDGRPAKKVRLCNGTSASGTPGTPGTLSDREIMQTAPAAKARRQEEAFARASEKSGETKWVLSFKDAQNGRGAPAMQVRQAGFAAIDAEDSDEEEEQRPVRMQFGGGVKKKLAKSATPTKTEESVSDSDSGSSSDGLDSDDPTAEVIRETKREVAAKERDARKARKKVIEDTPRRPAAPMDEDMDLGGLISLSGGGRNSNNLSNVECFRCKQKGHFKDQCPKSFAPRGSAGRGRNRGRR